MKEFKHRPDDTGNNNDNNDNNTGIINPKLTEKDY